MRALEILLYLMKKHKTTVKELSEEFNISKRTIHRELDKLSILGIPIISKRGSDGGIFLDKNYMISKVILTEQEYKSMITSLYIGENIGENIESISILKKLFLINPIKLKEFHDEVAEYFVIDLVEKKINMFEESNESINYALETKSIIKVYIGKKSYKIKPISYILKPDSLYLYAYCEDEYVLIDINEIDTIEILEENYDRNFIHYKSNKDINIRKIMKI